MTEPIRIFESDTNRVDELVKGDADEMTWAMKINKLLDELEDYKNDE